MPLYVEDAEVDDLTERLAAMRKLSKTEIIRQALRREMERYEAETSLVDKGVAFVRALKAKGDPSKAGILNKAFIDSLYE
jgi:antitoxin VapB